jgi:hypothetical protein
MIIVGCIRSIICITLRPRWLMSCNEPTGESERNRHRHPQRDQSEERTEQQQRSRARRHRGLRHGAAFPATMRTLSRKISPRKITELAPIVSYISRVRWSATDRDRSRKSTCSCPCSSPASRAPPPPTPRARARSSSRRRPRKVTTCRSRSRSPPYQRCWP